MSRRIAVAAIHRNAPSETFIRAHVSGLPAQVHFMTVSRHEATGEHLPDQVCIGLDGQLRPLAGGPEGTAAAATYLREQSIERVLAEYGPVGAAMAPACDQAGVPIAVHFHGYDVYRRDVVSRFESAYSGLFRTAQACIGVSRVMCADLVTLGAPRERVHLNPCGYDDRLFRPTTQPGTRPPVFLFVGRLVEKKGPLQTLRAFGAVHRQVADASLVVVGDGPLMSDCQALAKSLGIEARVRFLGALPHDRAADWFGQARVLVQHSITAKNGDREGTPIALLEAGGAGLPVVATRHGGIPEVVADGVSGLLVDEGDVEAMAAGMVRLAEDGALATRLGRAGHERARRDYALDDRLACLWQIVSGATKGGDW